MTRLSIPADAYIMPEDFVAIYDFNTHDTINALGIAASDIAEMGLREISRTVMQARQEQNFAKKEKAEYDTAIHSASEHPANATPTTLRPSRP